MKTKSQSKFKSTHLASALLLLLLLANAYRAAAVGPSLKMIDASGLLALVSVLAFSGSWELWWTLLMPLTALFLFFPILILELRGGFHLRELLGASLIPGLSLTAVALITSIRQTRASSDEAGETLESLYLRTQNAVHGLRHMESEMKSLFSLIRAVKLPELKSEAASVNPDIYLNSNSLASAKGSVSTEFEDVSEARVLGSASEVSIHYPLKDSVPQWQCVEPMDVFEALKQVTAEFGERMKLQSNMKNKVRLILSGPNEILVPTVVRADLAVLTKVVRSMIAQSIDALRGGDGIVRINMRLRLGELQITIEDNGPGLSEAMLEKLAAKGFLQNEMVERLNYRQTRQSLESFGCQMEMAARLGVGTRIALEMPRLDSYSREHMAALPKELAHEGGYSTL